MVFGRVVEERNQLRHEKDLLRRENNQQQDVIEQLRFELSQLRAGEQE